MSRRPVRLLTVAVAAALTLGVAACDPGATAVEATTPPPQTPVGGTTPQPAPTDSAPTDSAPTDSTPTDSTPTDSTPTSSGGPVKELPGTVVPNKDGRKAAPDGAKWKLALKGDKVPDATWPDAKNVFSKAELKAIFPDATSIKVKNCLQSKYLGDDGDLTKHATECDIEIKLPRESSSLSSKLTLRINGFGPKQKELEDWERMDSIYRQSAKKYPDNYRFYKDGAFGALKVSSSGVTTRILVGNDKVAGEFSIGAIGFYRLSGEDFDYDGSKKIFNEQIMPLLVKTLASKM